MTGYLKQVTLSDQAQTDLKRLIRDPKKVRGFIRAAESAISIYEDMRPFSHTKAKQARDQLNRVQRTADRYAHILKQLDIAQAWCQTGAVSRQSLEELVRDSESMAKRMEKTAVDILKATKPGRRCGRPTKGAVIILIQALAKAFEAAGEKASSADRSRFVHAVTILDQDAGLELTNVRESIRTACGYKLTKNI